MIFAQRTPKALLVGLLAAGATTLLACGGILGFESLSLEPSDSGAVDGGGDARADGEEPGSEGSADAAPAGCEIADLQTSAQHCGRCNHGCAGSSCRKGMCQPLKLAEGLKDPEGLVVDDVNVYVAENDANRIMRLDKTPHGDCSVSPLPKDCVFAESNAFVPTAMGIDDNNVYWTSERRSIRSCPRAGCGGQSPELYVSSGDPIFDHNRNTGLLPLELIVRDGEVFYPESYTGAVRSVNIATKAVTTYLAPNGGNFAPVALAVDATHVFFTGDSRSVHAAEITSLPRAGAPGAVTVVANSVARTWGLALASSGTLYWTVPFIANDGDGKVQASLKTAINSTPLGDFVGGQDDPRGILTDAVNVYWITGGSLDQPTGKVLYCPQSGCPADGPIVLADGQRVPRHITQDETAIYWSNEGLFTGNSVDGQVWKVSKP